MFFLVRAQKGAGIEKVAGDGHCCRRVRGEGGGGGQILEQLDQTAEREL